MQILNYSNFQSNLEREFIKELHLSTNWEKCNFNFSILQCQLKKWEFALSKFSKYRSKFAHACRKDLRNKPSNIKTRPKLLSLIALFQLKTLLEVKILVVEPGESQPCTHVAQVLKAVQRPLDTV